ncbi:MAG: DnaD domain protein [Clostridia bacterium]
MEEKNKYSIRLSPEYVMGGFTSIDNIFICEYMKNADEIDTKLYIYALYLAHAGIPSDLSTFTSYLGVDGNAVIAAFEHFEEHGLMRILSTDPLDVVFQSISNSPIKPRKIQAGKYNDFNKEMQHIITGRMISPNEFNEYYNVLELFHMQQEAFILITKYCAAQKGGDINAKYITQTAKNFAAKKLLTVNSVEQELSNYELQSSEIAEVIKKLGLKKKVELEDNDLYKKWITLGFDKTAILCATSLIKGVGASVRKLDAFILELYQYKKFNEKEIIAFSKSKQDMRELAIEINKSLSVYLQSLDAEINTYILKWLGLGFSNEMLIKIADFCFQNELRSLTQMDEVLSKFYKLGVITLDNFANYIENLQRQDLEIKKLFEILSINRRINAYDRKNYKKFVELGFTSEMIMFAAELSVNASTPYPYMLAVLVNWKNNNIFTVEQARKLAAPNSTAKQSKREDILEHNYTKEQLNAVLTSIEDMDII